MTKDRDVLVLKQRARSYLRVTGVRFLDQNGIHEILRSGLRRPRKSAAWLAIDSPSADLLLAEVQNVRPGSFGTLALLEGITPSKLALAGKYFRTIFLPELCWLPPDELITVLASAEPRDRIVCGMVDEKAGNLLVYRGDLEPVLAPLASFQSRAGVEPDFRDFAVIDRGNAIRFGPYEASADAILYENDPDFRRRKRRQRHAREKTFGACLRRLRLQRELRQSDFEPVLSARTIARIENNEIAKPHGKTLQHISRRLSVVPDQIESY